MSTTSSDRSPTVECNYPSCDNFGKVWEFHHGKYCSNECETRHDGRKAIAGFLYDHCICATCFSTLKTISPSKPDFEFTANGHGWTRDEDGNRTLVFFDQEETRQAAIGFQDLTPYATKGEKQVRDSDHVITGTICDHCGNTDHTHHDTILASAGAIERLIGLLSDEDDTEFNPVELCRVYSAERDLDLAVGKALLDTNDD